ncbi:uncharacterized protein DUF1648 [Gramella sp. Hel_I_59]|uniref:DUF1648 domain-containing protein n=1 Tax=Gramella sp. Hel_I_59 TaxID=1249978 RepID=UPI001150354B|nr:DUF1648 domain-containing protein [Gramella sp. Hel_I_59]TQI71102.1 uncharacterized protein DUF1648 [Gramella sp. Hel_I_59]
MKVSLVKGMEFIKTDKILDITSWLFLLIIWLITVIFYQNLPNEIPTHFNYQGMADNFGNRKEIFILPILATVLNIALTFLSKFLNSSNFLNKRKDFQDSKVINKIIRFFKVAIPLIFGLIIYHTIEIAKNKSNGLGYWLLILTIIIINIPNLYYIIISIIKKNKIK